MKNYISLLVSIAALVFSVLAYYRSTLPVTTPKETHFPNEEEDEKEEFVEVADLMFSIQNFHTKLYLAAKSNNEQLCAFYVHEMGEKMHEVSTANVWSNGINVSENMRVYGLKTIDQFQGKKPAEILGSFENLTQACNSCHVASKHPELKIKTPVDAVNYNQEF